MNKKIVNTDLIIEFLIRRRIDISGFCMMCNISEKIFSDIMMQNVTIDVLFVLPKIAKLMGVPFELLYGANKVYMLLNKKR